MIQEQEFKALQEYLVGKNVTLVAVSKFQPPDRIEALYAMGQRDFGENYVQELVTKYEYFKDKPGYGDIRWHFIGHLQRNKVKYIAPFIHLVHSVDNFKLLKEIQKEATRHKRVIDCLLQLHIAEEDTKFGMTATEATELMEYYKAQQAELTAVAIRGVMGMASISEEEQKIRAEFAELNSIFSYLKSTYFLLDGRFSERSMGMSADYEWAIAEGSTIVRIGSTLFGARR